MRKSIFFIAVAALFAAGTALATQAATSTTTPARGIRLGQTYTSNTVSIRPLSVVSDNRCPKGVLCIVAGTVKVRAYIWSGKQHTTQVLMLGTSTLFAGKNISLTEVTPYPEVSKKIAKSTYRFMFAVSVAPTTTPEGQHCGGFIMNAPVCPTGYHCQLNRSNPDVGGTCVKD